MPPLNGRNHTRLGVYVDDVYHVDEQQRISTDRAFLLFVCEVGRHFDELALFGRTLAPSRPADYVLPPHARLIALPYYVDLKNIRHLLRTMAATTVNMWRGLDGVDTVWVFGPHPLGFLLIALALARRKAVVLGVREETITYARHRMAGRRLRWLQMLLVRTLDGIHRLAARRLRCTMVGEAIADRYPDSGPHLVMTVSLVTSAMLDSSRPPTRPSEVVDLLTVGRLASEKNPLLVLEMLAELQRRHPRRYRLTWVGRGELEDVIRARAKELAVDSLLELRGYVPFGEQLLELYRNADVFVHISHTEGVPQVLIEAMATSTPIVATAVGGVPGLLCDGHAGVLVPPDDLPALIDAIERVNSDPALRSALVQTAREVASGLTREAQSARVARFIAA